ncbi:hypothetical protein NG895_14035 [Aeoliella sp. ICT_H6.2]|uniref:Uncharacterized protein n=1 Tax=Aeoliella straminimaris TaxID=2954799 RepID=A0A9X2JGG5_9BACT|nr:hypothetical protein [Aeoliella straminimaris]MCO6045025.1 hypothetical protein [Aeoliella straminimaris]
MNSRRNCGATMLVVLAVIGVSAVVLAYATESMVDHHRQARLRHEHRQCRLLSEAALARAELQLASSAEYSGETWQVAAADSGLAQDALVLIEVKTSEGGEPMVIATTQYPATGPRRVTHTEQRGGK